MLWFILINFVLRICDYRFAVVAFTEVKKPVQKVLKIIE